MKKLNLKDKNCLYCGKIIKLKVRRDLVRKNFVDELKVGHVRSSEWRLKVVERDNYTCQKCGCKRKRLLQAHHKKPRAQYPELMYDVNNGETLCVYCHIKEHPKLTNFILSSLKIKLGVPYVTRFI